MRNNTERRSGVLGPVLAAAAAVGVTALLAGCFLYAAWGGAPDAFTHGASIVYAAVSLAVVGGVVTALVLRLRELRRGEEAEAKKY